jgi:hypothetical protein
LTGNVSEKEGGSLRGNNVIERDEFPRATQSKARR